MMVAVFWALVLVLFALATHLGRKLNLIPIVSQLLPALLGMNRPLPAPAAAAVKTLEKENLCP